MFQVGDKVKWCGTEGVVTGVIDYKGSYPVEVEFTKIGFTRFTIHGKFHDAHTEPSLVLVERPKKKVKKTFYQAVVKNGQCTWFYSMLFNSPESLNSYWLAEGHVVIGMHKIELEVEE